MNATIENGTPEAATSRRPGLGIVDVPLAFSLAALTASLLWQLWVIRWRDLDFLLGHADANDAVFSAAAASATAARAGSIAAAGLQPVWGVVLKGLAAVAGSGEPLARGSLLLAVTLRTMTGLFVERAGRCLGGAWVGAVAALAWAAYHLHPASLVSVESALPAALFALSLWQTVKGARSDAGTGTLFTGGVLLTSTALVEPSSAAICAGIALGLVVVRPERRQLAAVTLVASLFLTIVSYLLALHLVAGIPLSLSDQARLLSGSAMRVHHGDNALGELAAISLEAGARTLFGASSFQPPWGGAETLTILVIGLAIWRGWARVAPRLTWWILGSLAVQSVVLAIVLQESAASPRHQAAARVVVVVAFGGIALLGGGTSLTSSIARMLLVALPTASSVGGAVIAASIAPSVREPSVPGPGPGIGDTSAPPTSGQAAMPDIPHIFVDPRVGGSCTTYDPAARACDGGTEQAFATIDAAAVRATEPGIQVWLREGTYSESLRPRASGTVEQPIVFRGYADEPVVLTGPLDPAIDLTDRSHVIVERVNVRDVVGFVRAVRTRGAVIRDCQFQGASGSAGRGGLTFLSAHDNQVRDNVIKDGDENVLLVDSSRNVIASNTISNGRTAVWAIRCGDRNIIRGNTLVNERSASIGRVADCTSELKQAAGGKKASWRNLIERNLFLFTPRGTAVPAPGLDYSGRDGIVRLNAFVGTAGPGLRLVARSGGGARVTGNRVYHNVFYHSFQSGIAIEAGQGAVLEDNTFKNNILYENLAEVEGLPSQPRSGGAAGAPVQILLEAGHGYLFERNVIFGGETPEPQAIVASRLAGGKPSPGSLSSWQREEPNAFGDNIAIRPLFEDERRLHLGLSAQSALIDKGEFLTSATTSGSGTRLAIADPTYFVDGFEISGEQGDEIQLAGSGQVARIVALDDDGAVLQLDRPLRWKRGQGVTLRYTGTGPDPGYGEHVPAPSSADPVVVAGDERFGWDHRLEPGTTVRDYSFAAYVDRERVTLNNVACETHANIAHVTCAARLPAMSEGAHGLRVIAIRRFASGQTRESVQSSTLEVFKRSGAPR